MSSSLPLRQEIFLRGPAAAAERQEKRRRRRRIRRREKEETDRWLFVDVAAAGRAFLPPGEISGPFLHFSLSLTLPIGPTADRPMIDTDLSFRPGEHPHLPGGGWRRRASGFLPPGTNVLCHLRTCPLLRLSNYDVNRPTACKTDVHPLSLFFSAIRSPNFVFLQKLRWPSIIEKGLKKPAFNRLPPFELKKQRRRLICDIGMELPHDRRP